MGVRITISFEGLDEAISRFQQMPQQLDDNIGNQLGALNRATVADWDEGTPERSGRLKGGNKGTQEGMSVTYTNDVYYYKFVDLGHRTPSYFHRHGKIIPAKRVSHVEGRLMTERLVEFLEGNVGEYLEKAVSDLGN